MRAIGDSVDHVVDVVEETPGAVAVGDRQLGATQPASLTAAGDACDTEVLVVSALCWINLWGWRFFTLMVVCTGLLLNQALADVERALQFADAVVVLRFFRQWPPDFMTNDSHAGDHSVPEQPQR